MELVARLAAGGSAPAAAAARSFKPPVGQALKGAAGVVQGAHGCWGQGQGAACS